MSVDPMRPSAAEANHARDLAENVKGGRTLAEAHRAIREKQPPERAPDSEDEEDCDG